VKILITDIQTRKAFDIFHIYKSYGYEIICYSSGSFFARVFLSIIYKTKIHPLASENFLEDLQKPLKRDEEYIFFPVEEESILNFLKVSKKLSFDIKYLLPSFKVINTIRDKKVFDKFCQENSCPVPKSYEFKELLSLESLPSPLIIKPRIGSGAVGIKFIDTKDELLKLKDIDFSNYLIQERLPNSASIEGAFFLFWEGKLISYYGHKRIRTYPQSGGVSVYSKCELNDELKKLGSEVLQKLNYSGLAMVEFLYDKKANSYKIIEINPRSWGSIMLSEFCGANFLKSYVDILLKKELSKPKIDTNRFIRWVFPWDVILFLKSNKKSKKFFQSATNCCYINFSYANKLSSYLFLLYNLLKVDKIKKFFKKIDMILIRH